MTACGVARPNAAVDTGETNFSVTSLLPRPLGQRIPGALHSVSCSLPTMADVVGYEEKRAETVGQMQAGYPRFFLHPLLTRLRQRLANTVPCRAWTLWPVTSERTARALGAHLGGAEEWWFPEEGVWAVVHKEKEELATKARHFLQHTGGFLSSRAAEDALVRAGLLDAAEPEELRTADAKAEVQRVLHGAFPGTCNDDRFITASGMGAVWAAFRAVNRVQARRGRTAWVQLGWLYLDTIALLQKFTADPPNDLLRLKDVRDLAALRGLLEREGDCVAGIILEAPTNPLVQTPDVAAVAELARKHGVLVVIDPAIASPLNVDVLPHADLVACSLTKYTAHEGDVMAGLAVVNPRGPDAGSLRSALREEAEPLYPRDLARLAAQIGGAPEVLARIGANARRVAEFLGAHPRVRRVWWAGQRETAAQLRKIARTAEPWGGVVSFVLNEEWEQFYDEVNLAKGPSFGMGVTLLCPYIYLAHYELVGTTAGRAELVANDLEPGLLRLSVGVEPVEEIIAELERALG
jgi:cystathionine gamma-synthase